jgi:nucleoside-diphosphate-sugar epimerase
MRNVVVLGANGRTSAEIIDRLLARDDVRLTLFLRRASRLKHIESPRVELIEGDARNTADLRRAIGSHDIVVSTLGGMDLDFKTSRVIEAMQAAGAQRLVAISAGGIHDELPEPFNAWDKRMVGETRPVNLRAVQSIEQSPLVYTILRPVWLTDKPTEVFELTTKGEVYKGTETSRASIGRFMADLVDDPARHAQQNLGISQPGTDGSRPLAYR